MHLEGEGAGLGLTLALPAGALAQAGEVLLSDGHVAGGGAGADVVDQDLEVHLGLAAEPFDVGDEVALVGADGAAQTIVVGEGGVEAEGKHGGEFEAVRDDACVILGGLLIEGWTSSGLCSETMTAKSLAGKRNVWLPNRPVTPANGIGRRCRPSSGKSCRSAMQ